MAGGNEEQQQELLNDAVQDLCYQQQLLAYNMSLLQCQFQTSFASLKDTVEQYMWSLSATTASNEEQHDLSDNHDSSEEEEEEQAQKMGHNEREASILYHPESLAGCLSS